MAVEGTKSTPKVTGGHGDHGGNHDSGRAKGDGGGRVGETKPPSSQAEGGERNVGAKPPRGGSGGATGARDGASQPTSPMLQSGGDDHGHGHGGSEQVPAGTPNLLQGSSGPIVREGDAATIKIPDGPGFGGEKGRKQNDGDREQNNYSVTDANFNPSWGLMARDPDTGEEMTYVKHIQSYNAAGYVNTFAPDTAKKLQQAQDSGAGMFLEGASYLMGLTRKEPSFLAQYGIDGADIPARIPGTDRDAREYVKDGQDATGQDWARMHHPGSAWDMYKGLIGIGVDGEQALRLAGDDGVSGAGRLNGQNNQDGGNGFNAGEAEVWKEAARLQQRTGLPVIQTMMAGHDHNHLDASALTDPAVNARLGITGRDASPQRAQAIYQGLLAGRLDEDNGGGGGGGGAKGAGGGGGEAAGAAGDGGGGGADAGDAGDAAAEEAVVLDAAALAAGAPVAYLSATAPPAEAAALQQLLAQALGVLQQSSPEIYQLLMAMQQQGVLDASLAAGVIFGVFDDPGTAALVAPEALAAVDAALTGQGIGRAGVDPRIPGLPGMAAGTQGAAAGTAMLGMAPAAASAPAVASIAGGAAVQPGVSAGRMPAAMPLGAMPATVPLPGVAVGGRAAGGAGAAPAGAGHAHAH